jgi:quercetin dioxygenase-like cupin family protein
MKQNEKIHTPMQHVDKGWGWERWIVNKEEYCGKLLFFNKGKRCSWHFHKIKDEVFYLQSGQMTIHFGTDDDLSLAQTLTLNPGDNFHIPVGLRHQMIATEDSELFEFSTQHFDSDSYRVVKGD